MEKIKLILRLIIRLYFAIRLIKWKLFYLNYDSNANIIVWFYPNQFLYFIRTLPLDLVLLSSIINTNRKFNFCIGTKIGKFNNKTIFFNFSSRLNPFGFQNYVSNLNLVVEELNNQGNRTFPSLNDSLYWENKEFMYRKFQELKINEPNTRFYVSIDEIICKEIKFPFLLKTPHSSGSQGVFNVNSTEDLLNLSKKELSNYNQVLLVQDRLNIRKDMRIILIGNKIVEAYWRINNSSEWKTTSTGHGSTVIFGDVPLNWKDYIIKCFIKTGLVTGAFDLGWENDDLTNQPIFFEVSPSYDLNPIINGERRYDNYGSLKKQLKFIDGINII